MPRLAPTMSTEGAPLAAGAGASCSAKRATLPAAAEERIILALDGQRGGAADGQCQWAARPTGARGLAVSSASFRKSYI